MLDVYVGWYSDRYGQTPYTAPTARQPAQLARRDGRLVLLRLGHSVQYGAKTSEGFARVSAKFELDEDGGDDVVDVAVAPVWAAHYSDPDATLALHLDVALQDGGFRKLGGASLRDGWEG